MATTIHGTNGITFNDGSTQNTRPAVGFRNRIINGDMRIDQRNAGAAVSWAANTNGYTLDRWKLTQNGTVASTVQRSTVVPAGQGFTNSLLTTITAAETAVSTGNKTAGYYYMLEGYNVSDFGWGTASAQTITISFWVRSSVAGTYSFSVMNTSFARSYNSRYTISEANTWEKKTFTITGDTGATSIDTTNGISISLVFDLGFSTMYETYYMNSWLETGAYALAGCTKLSSTVGATFYLTGVQLEAGSTASDFERRPIGTELALCQRYYQKTYDLGTAPGTATTVGAINYITYGTFQDLNDKLQVEMRGIPSEVMIWNPHTGTSGTIRNYSNGVNYAATINGGAGTTSSKQTMFRSNVPATGNNELTYHITASAEL